MKKIAIVNVGMHGHVNPTLGFTEELVRRGNEVVYFGTRNFQRQIERTGARLVEYGSELGKLAESRATAQLQGQDPWKVGTDMRSRFLDELEQTLPPLLAELERERPDVVVYDFISLAGRLAARRLGLPAVKFFTTYASNSEFNLLGRMFAEHAPVSTEETAAQQERLAKLAARHGTELLDPKSMLEHTENANLVFMPRSFQPSGDTFDRRFLFVGPCLRQAELEATTGLLPPGKDKVLLISLGTIFNAWPEFYRECLTAFGGESWRVVMAVGPHIDPLSLGELPPNVVVRPHLPQLALLQQAELFVSHGGMNSTMEALSFGVPLVAIPQMPEQEMTARRLAELGLGRYLPRAEVTAAGLAKAVGEVASDQALRARVKAMQADVKSAGGTPRAADIIEAAAGGRQDRPARSTETQSSLA